MWQMIPTPLDMIFSDIDAAFQAGLPYMAIAVSLTIPDICAACETNPPWTNEKRYVAWCEAYVAPKINHFTGKDCYRIRCGVLHQGRFGRHGDRYDRVIFTYANSGVHGGYILMTHPQHGTIKVLPLHTPIFCKAMVDGALQWREEKKDDRVVAQNIDNLVRKRPNGFEIAPGAHFRMPLIT